MTRKFESVEYAIEERTQEDQSGLRLTTRVQPGSRWNYDPNKGVAENQALATFALANSIMQVGYSLINSLREIANQTLEMFPADEDLQLKTPEENLTPPSHTESTPEASS